MCEFLNLNVNQGVITAKSFQNTINNWSGMVNLFRKKKKIFLGSWVGGGGGGGGGNINAGVYYHLNTTSCK